MSGEEIFRRFASMVLFITCEISPEEGKQGSGALVSADGFIATNAHVIEGCLKVTATYLNGTLQQSLDAKLKFYNHQTDTAIIKIDAQGANHFDVVQRPIRSGEHVYAIGNPQGFAQSITDGMVTGIRQFGDVLWLQHSASTSPGSSGGALISSQGELLGIHSRATNESQNLNFAVPPATLANAVSSARARVGYLRFPPEPVTAAPSANARPGPPADAAGAFAKRDYLMAIQLAQQNVAAGVDSGRNYALIGSSYCELGKTADAAPYIAQAFVLLRDDDSYLQTAILCRLLILAEKWDQGQTQVRSELAQTATRFLASSKPVLPGWHNLDPRSGIATILGSLQSISGDWVDETNTIQPFRQGVFCRSSGCPRTSVHIGDRSGDGSYYASGKGSEKESTGLLTTHESWASVYFEPQGAQYQGPEFKLIERWDNELYSIVITQSGIMNSRLSPDTTTLTGDIQFGPPTVNAQDLETCQGCIAAGQWAGMDSVHFRVGTFQVRLVRK